MRRKTKIYASSSISDAQGDVKRICQPAVGPPGCGRCPVADLRPARAPCGRQLSRPPGGSVRQRTLCQEIRTGPLRSHPRGRGCYLHSPAAADRPEPVAQPPSAPVFSSLSHASKNLHGPACESDATGQTPPNRRHIPIGPSHTRFTCTDSSCTNDPCTLRGALNPPSNARRTRSG